MSKKSKTEEASATNYQTVEIGVNISGYKRGDYEIVDIDSPFWSNHYLAGNITIIAANDPAPADSYYEDDEAYD